VAQVIENLPTKYKALNLNPSTAPKKRVTSSNVW
jgi:hypothetical protein